MKAYPVTKTIIDDLQLTQFRFLFISKSMQIKTIAENIRALYIDIDIDIDIDLDIDIYHLWQLKEANKEFNIYIYIYIHSFSKRFSYREIYR